MFEFGDTYALINLTEMVVFRNNLWFFNIVTYHKNLANLKFKFQIVNYNF